MLAKPDLPTSTQCSFTMSKIKYFSLEHKFYIIKIAEKSKVWHKTAYKNTLLEKN